MTETETEKTLEQFHAACSATAAATQLPVETVRLVAAALVDATLDADDNPVSAGGEEVVRALLQRVAEGFHDPVEVTLDAFKIETSADIGRVVFTLVDHGVIGKEPMDSQEDFDGIFDRSNLNACLAAFGIEPPRRRRRLRQLSFVAYATALGLAIAIRLEVIHSATWVPVVLVLVLCGIVLRAYKA